MKRLGAAAVLILVATAAFAAFAAWAPAPLVSDFRYYHEAALGLLRGEGLSDHFCRYHCPGLPFLLSWVYRASGPWPAAMKAVNVLLLVGLGLLTARRPSRAGAFPAELVLPLAVGCAGLLPFVALIATELPYTALLALGVVALGSAWPSAAPASLSLAGVALGVSQAVRPVTLPFLAVLCVVALCVPLLPARAPAPARRERARDVGRRLAPVLLAFVGTAGALYAAAGYGWRLQPKGNGLWSLYLGANPASLGSWTASDSAFLASLDAGPQAHVNVGSALASGARERWRRHLGENLALWPAKLGILMAPDANLGWAWPDASRWPLWPPLSRTWRGLAAVVALCVLLAVARSAWRGARLHLDFPFLAAVSVGLYLPAHALLLEVNSRYGVPWLWLLCWLWPWALAALRPTPPDLGTARRDGDAVDSPR